jgi:glyoxylase-like metal-dependent hydrolase (beta-lactamase superfamily II)
VFLTEPEPARGAVLPVAPGIGRIVAPNPGAMTCWGTNTYLIEEPGGHLVMDPGPDDAGHVAAILAAGPVTRIMLTHTHPDHLDALPALRAATGAPVSGWHAPEVPAALDGALQDGDGVGGWQALHTPGHAPDHLCFAGPDDVLFSGDHVMGWSTSTVAPGGMAAYFASLRRLLARNDRLLLPGHGPPVPQPRAYVQALLDHRLQREAAILAALGPQPRTSRAVTAELYADVDPRLLRAAERNVIAHLDKLRREGRVRDVPEGWTVA